MSGRLRRWLCGAGLDPSRGVEVPHTGVGAAWAGEGALVWREVSPAPLADAWWGWIVTHD